MSAPVPRSRDDDPSRGTDSSTTRTEPADGLRLAALEGRLRLLVLHLAGRAILARAEIDDLVQEVFLRAVSSGPLPRREPDDATDAALYRYLSTIARHAVIDAARAIRTRKREGITDRLLHSEWSQVPGLRESQVAGGDPGPPTRAVGAEGIERLARGFQALDPDHRRVIGLRQFEGLSAAESARRMGRSETAVHSLYRRALEAWEQASL
jgi:RNA polymerase sigma factor (sigma-70 family)